MKDQKQFTEIWQRESARREQEIKPEDLIEREFAGLPCVARRLDLSAWIIAGRIPDFLAVTFMEAEEGKRSFDETNLTPKELAASLKFQRDVVCFGFVNPKVVPPEKEPVGGEFAYTDFAINFRDACKEMIEWQMAGCPDVPVQTEGGEVSVNDLKNFRGKKRAGRGSRGDGAHKRRKAVQASRHTRPGGGAGA
jgi:hypothetical protein